MAIRPVDLQLAYLAGPQNAALVSSEQNAPGIAQQAAQVAFANQVHQREETIAETADTESAHLRADADGGGNADSYTPEKRQPHDAHLIDPSAILTGDGEHFIDVVV